VEDYSNCFQDLLARAGHLDEAQRVQLFTAGLLPPLSHTVRIHNSETLAVAMSLARQVKLMELDRL
jgi:ABC-type enterobactin transport system permease subunit